MSTKINLLPNAAKFKAYRQQWRQKNKKIVIWELVAGITLGAILIGANAGISMWSRKISQEAARWKQEFANLKVGVEASQKIKYQAKIVGKVMDQRFEYGQAFAAINKLFPAEVIVEKSDFKDETTFNVEGMIINDLAVTQVEQLVADINAGKNEYFNRMELKQMAWSISGWKFGATVYLKI
jgi:hypothetical protein